MKIRGQLIVGAVALAAIVAAVVVAPNAVSSASGGPCTDASRGCVIATSQTYLDGLVKHSGAAVRFAPGVVRYENGLRTGNGAMDLRHQLSTSAFYKIITGIRDEQWIVEGKVADAFYLIDTGAVPGLPGHTATAHVAERFTIDHGLIQRLDVVVCFAGGVAKESATAATHFGTLDSLCARVGPIGL